MLEKGDQMGASRTCRTMPIYREILEEYGLCIMNKKPIWFRGNKKSLIDHIATNAHHHIDNITTTPPGISDHGMVIFNLRTSEITDNPKYHLSQNMKNANPLDVELLASFNLFLQQIWSTRDVHETWTLLDQGIEDLSNMLAPTKVVQHRSNFQPYLTESPRI